MSGLQYVPKEQIGMALLHDENAYQNPALSYQRIVDKIPAMEARIPKSFFVKKPGNQAYQSDNQGYWI